MYSIFFIWGDISDDISPNEIFEYGHPHSNALLQFRLKLERCKPHKAACHPTIYDVINDSNFFRQYTCYILSQIYDVIQSDVALQKQMH